MGPFCRGMERLWYKSVWLLLAWACCKMLCAVWHAGWLGGQIWWQGRVCGLGGLICSPPVCLQGRCSHTRLHCTCPRCLEKPHSSHARWCLLESSKFDPRQVWSLLYASYMLLQELPHSGRLAPETPS